MRKRPPKCDKNYEVGYGRPPKQTQFKKGVSGNPAGRKKLGTSTQDVIARVAAEMVTVRVNGTPTRLPMHEVVIRQTYNRAAEGNSQALKTVIAWHDEYGIGEPKPDERKELPSVVVYIPHNGRNDKDTTVYVEEPGKPATEWKTVRAEDVAKKK